MLDASAASTTPENRRNFPDAGSLTVLVLIERTVSMSGGACSVQAVNAVMRTTRDSSPVGRLKRDIGMVMVSFLVMPAWRLASHGFLKIWSFRAAPEFE